MNVKAIVEYIFLGLLSFFAWQLNANISEIQKTVSELNTQVGIIISESSTSKEILKDHESRIRLLEKQRQ